MTFAAIVAAALVLVGIYHFARHVAAHEHQPSTHPNQRCAVCGLDRTAHRRRAA